MKRWTWGWDILVDELVQGKVTSTTALILFWKWSIGISPRPWAIDRKCLVDTCGFLHWLSRARWHSKRSNQYALPRRSIKKEWHISIHVLSMSPYWRMWCQAIFILINRISSLSDEGMENLIPTRWVLPTRKVC